MTEHDSNRYMLRHALATLAYRAGKTVRGASASFADFHISEDGRTPIEILSHMGDLFEWALSMAQGAEKWKNAQPLPWAEEVNRFFASLAAMDAFLASESELAFPAERLFQGPIADALTHTGQLAMLRRLAGSNMKGENYSRAIISVGHVGPDQEYPQ